MHESSKDGFIVLDQHQLQLYGVQSEVRNMILVCLVLYLLLDLIFLWPGDSEIRKSKYEIITVLRNVLLRTTIGQNNRLVISIIWPAPASRFL